MTTRGLPHSEILGSLLVGSSPRLFAACYVLHRLSCQGIHLCALMYLLRRFREFEIAVHTLRVDPLSCLAHESSSLCSFQGTRTRDRTPAFASYSSERTESDVRTLKAKQCSPDEGSGRTGTIVLRETLDARAAQPKLKNFGLVVLIQPLAINGRVNPELRASSVVDH